MKYCFPLKTSKDIYSFPQKIVLAIFPAGCDFVVYTMRTEWKGFPCEYLRATRNQ